MTFALSQVRAFGIESEEAISKRYIQAMVLNITAANTDIDLDLGDYSGTFWTAVSGSAATAALSALKSIQLKAESFWKVGGTSIAGYQQADASYDSVLALDSTATAGTTGATRTLTVTGLLTTDTILKFTIVEDGANARYVQEAAKTCAVNGQYVVTFSGEPGAGLEGRVMISRSGATAVVSGTYQLAMDSTNTQLPNILFLSGDAPTSYVLYLEWVLKDGELPIEVSV